MSTIPQWLFSASHRAVSLTVRAGVALRFWQKTIATLFTSASRFGAAVRPVEIHQSGVMPKSQVPTDAPQLPGFQRVMSADSLLRRIGAEAYLKTICERTRFGQKVFDRDCMPVIVGLCDLVQLLPVTPSRNQHALAGMLIQALLSANIALQLRLGEILPRGGASEDVHKREHRWTYGVFLCALFRDLGNLCAEMRVEYRTADGLERYWHPVEGTLTSVGAVTYHILPAVDGEIIRHGAERLPLLFLHRLVPTPVLHWLADDRDLMDEILMCLSGVESDGAIAELTRLAHDEAIVRTSIVDVGERRITPQVEPPEVLMEERATAQRCRSHERRTNAETTPNQRELFDQSHELSKAPTAAAVTTCAVPGADERLVGRLQLPTSLTPLVREALLRIFEVQPPADGVTDGGLLDERGWFVRLDTLEKKGVDTGLALKCLMEIDALYLGDEGETRKVHLRSIEDTEVRGLVIKSTFVCRVPEKAATNQPLG